jgi:hypothetical protein
MGLDIKAALDQIVAFISQNYLLVFTCAGLLVLFSSKGVFARVRVALEKALKENWQLTLLASTGVALSLASGYTTFDGLRNFTSAPLLSVLISFGIQGVMLIVAWLIGESFAVGMNQRTADGRRVRLLDATVGMVLGVALVGLVFYWILNQYHAVRVTNGGGFQADMVRFVDVSIYFVMGLVLIALAAFGFRRGGEIATPYVQSLRLIMKNAVLWVMFLASMSASVFFSFDSHFNAIFPAEARKRAAEIRTTNQIGAAIADIGALAQTRQLEEADNLFKADGWKAYEKQLVTLAQAAQGAQAEIEQYFVQKLEERRRAINQQQERIATSQSGQAGMAVKKVSLTEELSRLKAERPGLATEYSQHKAELDAKAREIDAKRVEGMAEDRGVEGTLKQGKGPVYRQRMAELGTLQDQYKIKQERTKDAQKRVATVETRIAQIERELSVLDGDLAKLKGEAETAEQRIKTAQAVSQEDDGTKLDPARVLPAFERARTAFRQEPNVERLAALQQQCASLLNAMSGTPAKEKTRGIDCDPKQASDAAARVFALNAGLVAFQASCAGGDKVAKHTTTDSLLAFGRGCLQDSGLISKDSADVGAKLSAIDMNRDDKAHRFVVTWNAFLDGNRLAYLALVLAIGVDALVFMSGLFGAQALRSPLSDVPSPKARSAEQLEAIIKNALGEERLESAELVLAAMHPLTGHAGYHAEIDLGRYEDEVARRIRKVLVAGSSIGAVARASGLPGEERYYIRSELFEYLSVVANTARETDREYADRKRLIQIVGVALEPNRQGNAEIVLRHVEPINPRHGFMAKVELGTVEEGHRRLVQDVLNAGMTLHAVQRHERPALATRFRRSAAPAEAIFFIRTDLFKTLLLYRAGSTALLDPRAASHQLEHTPRITPDPASRPRLFGRGKNGHGNGSAGAEGELESYFRENLLEALGLSSDSLDKIWSPEIAAEAVAAAAELKRQAKTNSALGEQLRLTESNYKRMLEEARDMIQEQCADDRRAIDLLNDLVAQIGKRIPALMLLPEGALIDRLVTSLEQAYGGNDLNDQEHLLLNRLKKLKGDIERMNLSEASSWKRLAHQFEHLNDPSVVPTASPDGTKFH